MDEKVTQFVEWLNRTYQKNEVVISYKAKKLRVKYIIIMTHYGSHSAWGFIDFVGYCPKKKYLLKNTVKVIVQHLNQLKI